MEPVITTDFLVVGAGPAGAALGCFLGQNGLKGVILSAAPSTADTPRAHLVNPFGIECLRDIGLEQQAKDSGVTGDEFKSMRWCRSMVGEEYGKVFVWGGHPNTRRDTEIASPCNFMDLPQSFMEPILVRYAGQHGFPIKFSSKLIDVERTSGAVIATVRDSITNSTFRIQTRYLFGADGGRSKIASMLDVKFTVAPSFGVACNVLFKADLTNVMHERHSQLHWIMKPDGVTRFGLAPTLRMVRPWKEWLLVAFTPGTTDDPFRDLTPQSPELINFLKDLIGDDSIDVEVERIDPWVVRETVAENYAVDGNIFLLGDAAHRHPPAYGLGSNTCIQDAYNLAWKVAYMDKGLAGPGLLQTYSIERQPVGARLVRESNECMGSHARIWAALGMFASSSEEGAALIKELGESTEAGAARRKQLHEALEGHRMEGEGLGLMMNQWYFSDAVYLDDEIEPRPQLKGDPIKDILISTYPGSRLPHAWLDKSTRRSMISTHDLAGKGAFSLFTGHGGAAWKKAADRIAKSTGIPINCHAIGTGLDWHDVYRDWCIKREVQEDGCVLVRPDRFVAWRSVSAAPDCEDKLLKVLDRVLARDGLHKA